MKNYELYEPIMNSLWFFSLLLGQYENARFEIKSVCIRTFVLVLN